MALRQAAVTTPFAPPAAEHTSASGAHMRLQNYFFTIDTSQDKAPLMHSAQQQPHVVSTRLSKTGVCEHHLLMQQRVPD